MLIGCVLSGYSQTSKNQAAHNTLTKKEAKKGYVLLFDGQTSAGWKSVKSDKFPEHGWSIANGELSVLPPKDPGQHHGQGGDIITVGKYKAFDFCWDFKLAKGGNSGLKYFVTVNNGNALGLEFQLIDDNEHPDAKQGKNGNHKLAGLYDLISAKNPVVFVADTWYHARLVVKPNNRVAHYLNNVKVLEYERGSQAFKDLVSESKYKKIPNFGLHTEGHILLQDHGAAISVRNMKLRDLSK